MKDYETALIYGTVSAATLPIGAVFGIMTTLSQGAIAMGIAFGAGALLFAVTVELYGSAIERLERREYKDDNVYEVLVTAAGAVVGAVLYILLCRWLDKALEDIDMNDMSPPSLAHKPDPREDVHSIGLSSESVSDAQDSGRQWQDSPGGPLRRTQHERQGSEPWSLWDGDNDEDQRQPTARGRKRAVLGVLQPGQFDKALQKAYTRSHSPRWPAEEYGTMTLSARDKYMEEMHRRAKEEQRICSVEAFNDLRVAGGIWLGVLLDGIPEAIMLGYLAAEYKLTFALVAALLIANFPEAFSSAALLYRRGVKPWKIILMWTSLCIFTGVVACVTAYTLPGDMVSKKGKYRERYLYLQYIGAVTEGMAGGAMLACISNIMLPEAFKHRGDMAGIFVLSGFLVAVMIKITGGVIQEELDD